MGESRGTTPFGDVGPSHRFWPYRSTYMRMRQELFAVEAHRGVPCLPAPRTLPPSFERIPLIAADAAPGALRGRNPTAQRTLDTVHRGGPSRTALFSHRASRGPLGGFGLLGGFEGSLGVLLHPHRKSVVRVGRELVVGTFVTTPSLALFRSSESCYAVRLPPDATLLAREVHHQCGLSN